MVVDIDKIKKSANIIGSSDKMNEMLFMVGQVASTDISVLVTGESGSGKEMVAKALHRNSKRKHEKLVTVNCAAIPSGIIESELFGHKKGAFTGATESRKGYFEAADKLKPALINSERSFFNSEMLWSFSFFFTIPFITTVISP